MIYYNNCKGKRKTRKEVFRMLGNSLNKKLETEFNDHDDQVVDELVNYLNNGTDHNIREGVWNFYNRCLQECNQVNNDLGAYAFDLNNDLYWERVTNFGAIDVAVVMDNLKQIAANDFKIKDPFFRCDPTGYELQSFTKDQFLNTIQQEAKTTLYQMILTVINTQADDQSRKQLQHTINFLNSTYEQMNKGRKAA